MFQIPNNANGLLGNSAAEYAKVTKFSNVLRTKIFGMNQLSFCNEIKTNGKKSQWLTMCYKV